MQISMIPFLIAYWRGLYELGSGRRLYVSRGVGTWGPPIRVLAGPEVTLFIIEPE